MRKAVLGICFGVLLVTIGFSVWWFYFKHGQWLSTDMALWGSFGSFLAGSIGVTFGLATVWMLAETLRIQRQELAATREELTRTRSVHEDTSRNMRLQYKLMLQERERKIFESEVFVLVKAIDEAVSQARVIGTKEFNILLAMHAQRHENFFAHEAASLKVCFRELGRMLIDCDASSEDLIYLSRSFSKFVEVFKASDKHGLFKSLDENVVDVLRCFYLDVDSRVEPNK
tara:strand:+ start:1672 stop:2358 length:687 start_codon:yes stop_codon:yes gene_type:complete